MKKTGLIALVYFVMASAAVAADSAEVRSEYKEIFKKLTPVCMEKGVQRNIPDCKTLVPEQLKNTHVINISGTANPEHLGRYSVSKEEFAQLGERLKELTKQSDGLTQNQGTN